MRKFFKWMIGMQLLGILFMTLPAQQAQAQPGGEVSYQTFYDNLSPYGQWVSDPQYGNVFVPNVGPDYRPYYSNGHWAMTDYGNTWVSDDPWGWACYHYGRWTNDAYYGWVWIPGSEWAPAWVDWRYGGGACGWAPLGPGISIGVSSYNCPDNWWVFVGPQYLYSNDFYHYWRGPQYNSIYIRSCPFMSNVYRDNGTHVRYNFGPRAEQIQAFTHHAVPVFHISGAGRPGDRGIRGNSISLYRPSINRSSMHTAHPSNVVRGGQAIGRPVGVDANRQPGFRAAGQQGQNRGGAQAGHEAHGNQPNAGAAHGGANQAGHQQNNGGQMHGGNQHVGGNPGGNQHAAGTNPGGQHGGGQPQRGNMGEQHSAGGQHHMGGNPGGGQHMGGGNPGGGQHMGGGGQHMGGGNPGGGQHMGGGNPGGGQHMGGGNPGGGEHGGGGGEHGGGGERR
jgi:hypothetical protein